MGFPGLLENRIEENAFLTVKIIDIYRPRASNCMYSCLKEGQLALHLKDSRMHKSDAAAQNQDSVHVSRLRYLF